MPMHYGNLSQHNQRVNVDHFSMVPRADVPRSTFTTEHTHKTTFQGGLLVPIFCDEVLPGDAINGELTVFARMATLLFPLMDAVTLETFFFFVPNRILWTNWVRMMGQQDNPSSSISYTVPQIVSPAGGFAVCSIYDYMGVGALVGQLAGGSTKSINALPFRAYNSIFNQWFRDQNIQNTIATNTGDGPDVYTDFAVQNRMKRHDYFTSALPWPLKGGNNVALPLQGNAPIVGIGVTNTAVFAPTGTLTETGGGTRTYAYGANTDQASHIFVEGNAIGVPQIYADLSQATGATINALRFAVQTQRFLERDARSGTRYTELLHAHFGVRPEDFRLQRPEYIGGGRSMVQTSAIPQTSATGLTGGTSALGALGATSTITGQHHFRYHATEHGFIIGLAHVDAELTYQQGVHRMFTRLTRYDYYWPVFAHLGEQAIRNDEIYVQGTSGGSADTDTFGYQERWAEYRHRPSRISGKFRSRSAGTIDPWHAAQNFATPPTLSYNFVASSPPFARNLAAGSAANDMQFLADMLFRIKNTRAMPMYSVPGGMDRF